MSRCIFCLESLDVTPGANHPKIPSEEHIIPNSLGGSRDCSTMDVCRECNSTLGETVDAGFINSPAVGMLRHQFKTPGYSGTVPDIILPTRSLDNGEPGRITFRPDATVAIKHEPTVVRDKKSDGEEILVAGHPDDVARIFGGIIRKALAKAAPEQIAAALSQLDEAVDKAVPELSDLYHVPLQIDLDAIYRGLIKIAFEFAHKFFGWGWTGSVDAVPLREIALGRSSTAQIKSVLQGVQVEFRNKLPLDSSAIEDHHVVAFLPGQPNMVLVSLFGEAFLTICVKLDADLDTLAGKMSHDHGIMVSIDPRTRKTTWVSVLEFTTHMAQQASAKT